MHIDDDKKKQNKLSTERKCIYQWRATKGLKLRSHAIGQMVDDKPDVILVEMERWKENLKAQCATIKEIYWHKKIHMYVVK